MNNFDNNIKNADMKKMRIYLAGNEILQIILLNVLRKSLLSSQFQQCLKKLNTGIMIIVQLDNVKFGRSTI